MNIAIRTDASPLIGTGHVMRCLTLADALKRQGGIILFLSRKMPDHLRERILQQGHEFKFLNSAPSSRVSDDLAHSPWLETTQEADAQEVLCALEERSWDWLVVDHYAIDARWEKKIRQKVGRILVIDDLADRQHDCDALLDQNYYANMNVRYVGKVPSHCQLLLGPRYALLREEFSVLRRQVKIRTGPVQRILIFFGGVDRTNYTGKVIKALSSLKLPEIMVDVVIGVQHPFLNEIKKNCHRSGFTCHVQTDRMAELMAAADVSIGAGGIATWERCSLGLPTITFVAAANQNDQVSDAASEGLLYAPDIIMNIELSAAIHVPAFIANSNLRKFISTKAMQLVDDKGSMRVTTIMNRERVEIRVARASDSESLFKWRNHPDIRAVSRNSKTISWKEHREWLSSLLNNPKRLLLIGEINGEPVGVVRFDMADAQAEVSIYMVPYNNITGYGSSLLKSAECWLANVHPELEIIVADVLGENVRSQKLFLGSGYQLVATSYLKRLQ